MKNRFRTEENSVSIRWKCFVSLKLNLARKSISAFLFPVAPLVLTVITYTVRYESKTNLQTCWFEPSTYDWILHGPNIILQLVNRCEKTFSGFWFDFAFCRISVQRDDFYLHLHFIGSKTEQNLSDGGFCRPKKIREIQVRLDFSREKKAFWLVGFQPINAFDIDSSADFRYSLLLLHVEYETFAYFESNPDSFDSSNIILVTSSKSGWFVKFIRNSNSFSLFFRSRV